MRNRKNNVAKTQGESWREKRKLKSYIEAKKGSHCRLELRRLGFTLRVVEVGKQ